MHVRYMCMCTHVQCMLHACTCMYLWYMHVRIAPNVATVGICLRGLTLVLGVPEVGTEAHSLAPISCSTTLITLFTSQLSLAISQLMLNLISGGNLLTSIDDSMPP